MENLANTFIVTKVKFKRSHLSLTTSMKTALTQIFLLLLVVIVAHAHGGKKESAQKHSAPVTDTMQPTSRAHDEVLSTPVASGEGLMTHDETKVTARFDEFPSLHPLIVHFAIVLIVVAAGMQLLNILLVKREIAWIITAILLAGVSTAWLAANNYHPHTDGLDSHAKLVLEQHDKWADWTIYSGIAALLLQGANLFVFRGKRWAATVIGAVLIISAISVSLAGHHGSQLTHIEGIGPQGKFLEMNHD